MKTITLVALLISVGVHATLASATCVIQSGWTNRVFNFSFPANMNYADNMAVGSVLATQSVSMPAGTIYLCGAGDVFTNTTGSYYTRASDSSGVMVTNVSGVGVRTTVVDTGGTRTMPYSQSTPFSTNAGGPVGYVPPTTVTIDFIKTGPITGGSIDNGYYSGMKGPDSNWFAIYNVPAKINLVRVGCTVTNTSINVPMGSINQSTFTGIGPNATVSSFSIPLSCIAGTKVGVTISGTADASGVAGVLALDSSTQTVATGVGLQVLSNNVPVTLGTPVSITTVPTAGAFSVPLTARYYQTAAQVKPGVANSTATFTMTYN